MYASIPLQDFTQDTQNSARVILGLRSVFVGIKQLLGSFIAYLTAYLVAIPFILLIRYLRYRIEKAVPKNIKIDSSNYANIREGLEKSTAIVEQLRPLVNLNNSHLPFIVRFLLNQIKKVVETMDKINHKIFMALSQLNDIPCQTQPSLFECVTESELWTNRPKVYQYRV